jgi:hypothetical protein
LTRTGERLFVSPIFSVFHVDKIYVMFSTPSLPCGPWNAKIDPDAKWSSDIDKTKVPRDVDNMEMLKNDYDKDVYKVYFLYIPPMTVTNRSTTLQPVPLRSKP